MNKNEEKHIKVIMKTLENKEVEIDLGISELIQELWDNNIKTFQCCQGNDTLGVVLK